MRGWPWIAGALVGGVLIVGAVSSTSAVRTVGGLGQDVRLRVVRVIAQSEGGGRFDAVNPNNEGKRNPPGPGLSFGFIQWTQESGHLGELLERMRAADPVTFDAVVGGGAAAAELLRVTKAGSLAPVAGAVLWDPRWTSKFVALGRHPRFIDVQLQMASEGIHMEKAIEAARTLGILSERGLALAFDRAVQRGEYGTAALARRLADAWRAEGWPASYVDRLGKFAANAVLQVSPTYQETARKRVQGILQDPALSDGALERAAVT